MYIHTLEVWMYMDVDTDSILPDPSSLAFAEMTFQSKQLLIDTAEANAIALYVYSVTGAYPFVAFPQTLLTFHCRW